MHSAHPRVSEVRQRICDVVSDEPGIHFRGLGREANISSAGQLRHHLDRLNRTGRLVEIADGRYKRFFVAGEQDPETRPEIARFARVVPRRIARLLLASPMNRTELRRSLGCADSTLGYHLARMVRMGDLAKTRGSNCCNYSLTSKDFVRKILTKQTSRIPHATAPENVLADRHVRMNGSRVDEGGSDPIERHPTDPQVQRDPAKPIAGLSRATDPQGTDGQPRSLRE